jgi:uncharacterized protein (TIGR02646 family)
MRQIVKGPEPEGHRRWKEENAAVPQNLTYENMPKAPIKLQMLAEQGYLCAYTMQRIQTVDDCHIEHVVPRNQSHRLAHLDIDYSNLLACAPSNTPGHKPKEDNFPYGAPKKGGTPVNDNNFVSPLREGVEDRFRYAPDGSVAPAANDDAATSTINILRLDHAQLKELRKAAIDERVLNRGLSADEAAILSQTIMTADPTGRIPEFCLAISQVAAWYASQMRNVD